MPSAALVEGKARISIARSGILRAGAGALERLRAGIRKTNQCSCYERYHLIVQLSVINNVNETNSAKTIHFVTTN